MLCKNKQIHICEKEPFNEDKLNRKEYGKILLQFFSNTEESLTLAINSGWGTGKTTFVLMLKQLLENDGFPTILFNAWENDYSDDALVSLIGEILREMKEYKRKNHIIDDDINKFVEDGAKLVKSIPHIIKILSANTIDLKNLKNIQNEFSYSLAQNKLLKYTENKKDISEFKKQLKKYVKIITNIGTAKYKPLIFFIDELDRCRPNYTIELLEKLKHIFNIEGIIFVLSIDKEELEKTLKVIYGDIKIDGYLRKFIDFTYNLPDPPIEEFCKHLLKTYGFEDHFNKGLSEDYQYASKRITKTMSTFANAFNFSLRKIEQCFSQLSIVLKSTDNNSDFFPIYTVFLICFKNNDDKTKTTYHKYINNKINDKEILRELNKFPIIKDYLITGYGVAFESYINLAFSDPNETKLKFLNKINSGNATEREKSIYQRIKKILYEHDIFFQQNRIVEYIAKKIEITDSFF
ncbi:MAG: hypothetical protein HQ534_05810 [Armatimonadetes bacterium]|nr:hypothetical protein [Armatimonadota bacterium]